MRAIPAAPLMLLATTLVACNDLPFPTVDRAERRVASPTAANQSYVVSAARTRTKGFEAKPADDAPPQPSLESAWAAQKLIRAAELRIQVADVPRAIELADSLARLRDALIADVHVNNDIKGQRNAQLVIRVPAARFSQTLAALRTLGDVKAESIGTEDVGKAYADLETRLAVKQQMVTRLTALLANRTGKLSDVLEVERELSTVITDLEQMKGERRYYDQRVAISSITVSLMEPGVLVRAGFMEPVAGAFRSSLEVLARSVAALVYLVTFLLPWVVMATGVWYGVRRIRRAHPSSPA